jgi:hypothetical protein
MAIENYPKDVQDIIEYTRLRKLYPGRELEFREMLGFKGVITKKQMYILLNLLRRLGSVKSCALCGRKLETNDESLCQECKKVMQMKHGGK